MSAETKILIIDDESPIREVLSASLRDEGYTVKTAANGDLGIKSMKEETPNIVLLDIWMPGSLDGIEVLTRSKILFPETEFIMISGHGNIETAVKATKLGAWDFIEKPLSMDKISILISNIIEYQKAQTEKKYLLNHLRKSIAIIGQSTPMIAVKEMIVKIAPSDVPVLLIGENGAGKALIGQNIHFMSSRASRAFVEINCASVADDLFETEFFGYEKGAFAGADSSQKGKIELAAGGTMFLDEIHELNPVSREKLISALLNKKFMRVGGSQNVEMDVRWIVSTSNPKKLDSEFAEKLQNALSYFEFRIPALKERLSDVPALLEHFSDMAARETGYLKKTFSEQAIQSMCEHAWPGNVREMKNFIERIYILTPSDFVDVHDLKFAGLDTSSAQASELSTFREARAVFEKEYIMKKISENSGNISRTAEVIGLERSYLHRKIKSFGIEVSKGNEE